MEVHNYRENNERMLRDQEHQNELNTQLVKSQNKLQRQMKLGSSSIEEKEGREDSRKRSHENYEHFKSTTGSHSDSTTHLSM